ncbi:MAG: TetR family transcriptional regulator [Desulfuromusa sp.]|nr:TetR family transcriptional regulator [Desulfuromusa sp.]
MTVSLALMGMSREDKLDYILNVTSLCFGKFGYHQITLDLIAEKAEVSKGTLTYYFRNREGLIGSLIHHHSKKLLTSVRENVQKETDPKDRIVVGLESLWDAFYNDHRRLKAYCDLSAQAFFNERLKSEIVQIERAIRALFMEPIKAIALWKPDYDENVVIMKATAFAGLIDGMVRQILLDPESFESVKVKEAYKQVFLSLSDIV